jgi:hypothetical protein
MTAATRTARIMIMARRYVLLRLPPMFMRACPDSARAESRVA